MAFFTSWQLWEELTFVLIMSMVVVFVAGYVKLWLLVKKARKHRLMDEENDLRRHEMRESGQILETPEEIDIPFGIRAIEQGVKVEGVWYVKDSVPIPESQRIGKYVKRKSDAEVSSNSRPSSARPALSAFMGGGRRAFSGFGLSSSASSLAPAPERQSSDAEGQSGDAASSHRTYKPHRSSQLRFSSYNNTQYDRDTLGKLEGSIAVKDNVQVRRPRGAGPMPGTGENLSSISLAENADNERYSGSSDAADGTFARQIGRANASQTPSPYTSGQTQQNDGYFAVPAPRTPAGSVADPFKTPDQTPQGSDTSSKYVPTLGSYHTIEVSAQESGLPLLQSESPERRSSTAEADFQRANTNTRHVNSGFSIFPAGTFSRNTESKEKEVERPTTRDSESSQNSGKRKPNKLQKKGRQSMTGPRRSDDLI